MGLIRGGLIFFTGLILLFSFLAMNTFLTIGTSLEYENVRAELSEVVSGNVNEEIDLSSELSSIYYEMNSTCANNEYIQLEDDVIDMLISCEVVEQGVGNITRVIIEENSALNESAVEKNVNQSYEEFLTMCSGSYLYQNEEFGYSLEIPCEVVAQGQDEVINYSFDYLTEKLYYQEYECDYWNCLTKTGTPLFLISEKSHDYWMNKFYFMMMVSLVLCGLVFFFSEKKTDSFITVSIILLVSALPLLRIYEFLSFIFSNRILDFLDFFALLFNQSHQVFKTMLTVSILLVAFSVGLKVWFFIQSRSKENKE